MRIAIKPERNTLLSFDLEEFDIPEEYGRPVPEKEQYAVTLEGLQLVLQLLDELSVQATFFTTASFAKANKDVVAGIAGKHEIASHGLQHTGKMRTEELSSSKKALEDLLGVEVAGFRSPRLQPIASAALRQAGYLYDSSDNPIYLPGRYNNFFKPRVAQLRDGIVHIPISATPIIRFPLFWLAFKNAPLPLVTWASHWCLRADGYVNIFFHPWELSDLSSYRCLPWFVRRIHGRQMHSRLAPYLVNLTKTSTFITMREFAKRLDFERAGN